MMLLLNAFIIAVLLPVPAFGVPASLSLVQADAIPQRSDFSKIESDHSPKATRSSGWQHPGYIVSKSQLEFVKTQIVSKAQPWSSALSKMLEDGDKYGKYASAERSSKAQVAVKCGPTTNPDIGCTDERGDALAAWASALAGYVSSDESHTKNAIALMNKWSGVIKSRVPLVLCFEKYENLLMFY